MERPSAELLLKFSIIWGEKTTTQHAIDIEPVMPLSAAMSTWIMTEDRITTLGCRRLTPSSCGVSGKCCAIYQLTGVNSFDNGGIQRQVRIEV